jgi:hypothetical protein
VHLAENVVVAVLLVGVEVMVGGGVELTGAEVGGTVELTGEEVGGGTTVPPEHNTVASWSATAVCA